MSLSHSNTESGAVHSLVDEEVTPGPASDVFPEGGRDGWLTVAGGQVCLAAENLVLLPLLSSSMVTFCTFGAIQSFGIYQDYYTRVFLNEHPPSNVSWIGSVQIFFLFAIGIFSGRLFDEGYFRHLLAGGSILYLVSSFLLSLAKPHHYYQNFLAQAVGMGIGMGIVFLPCLSVSAHYFKRKRGVAIGIILSGSSVGAVIYPIMINHLFKSKGFTWGVRAVSFLDLSLLFTANWIMKTRLPPRPAVVNMKSILRDFPFWICLIGEAITFWGLFIPSCMLLKPPKELLTQTLVFYIQLYAVKNNASEAIQTYSVAILNAAGFFGRTIPMIFSDLWGPLNVILPLTFISGSLSFAFIGAKTNGGLVVFVILYGFFSGGFVSLSVPASASFSRNVGEIGTRIGFMSVVCSFTLLTGNPISGALLHPPRYTWFEPIVFSGVTIFCGFSFLIVAGYLQRKQRNS
ncbi:MFS general substrate transporter [Mycena venus]|uniref:MFS general substrate transporter n=1 Tax=Mycena venus TaxID=2733690 RepID=A0A8H6Z439_9AGAR|nr:MFS general substrate transporter [Mycena venus]